MASPFQVATLGNVNGLPFSPHNKVAYLHDGSLLVAVNTGAAVASLYRVTSPSSGAPGFTVLTQTFTIASSTALVNDLLTIQGSGTTDIWLAYTSDATSGTAVNVAHATFDGTSFTWDNTGTLAATPGLANSQVVSIVWTGSALIIAYRDGSWKVMATYTTTKAGGSGWQTPFQLGTTTSTGSHANPILRRSGTLAGGSAGATIVLYPIDSTSGHTDQWAGRTLLDSASSPALANWGSETTMSGVSGQNTGAALFSACVDGINVHLVFSSTAAGTGGAVGVSYSKVTVSSGGAITFGSRVTVDTTTGGGTNGCCVDVNSQLFVFYGTGAVGTAGTISYRTATSPYTSFSSATGTVGSTTGDGFPHVPSHGQQVSGYVPLLFQRGTASFTAQFDNTITAGSPAFVLQGQATGVAGLAATPTTPPTVGGIGATDPLLSPQTLPGSPYASMLWAQPLAQSLPSWPSLASASGAISQATATASLTTAVASSAASFTTVSAALNTTQASSGLIVNTQTQSGITGGPPGNNTTETDVTWTDSSGNGWRVGMIPAYGGALISPWYELTANVASITQTSLATSVPDGFIHVLAQSAGAVFTGTEDPTYTLTEMVPTGQQFRRGYDSGTMTPSTGPALNYRIRTYMYPGDPALLVHRIDITNPSGSAVTLAGSDSLEIANIGGLNQVLQSGTNAWQPANGLYANVGGSETAWPTSLTTTDPDYYYITPQSGAGLTLAPIVVRKTGLATTGGSSLQIQYLQNANRLKIKLQETFTSFPGSTTYSLYYLQALKKSVAAGEANSVAADYLNPGTPTMTAGSFTSFSYDEGAYVFASATGNTLSLSLTISGSVSKRWHPRFKITGWTGTTLGPVTLSGAALVSGTDYLSYIDTGNQIAYLVLLKHLVVSGAVAGELNNGPLVVGVPLNAAATAQSTVSGALGLALPLSGSSAALSTAGAAASEAVVLSAGAVALARQTGTVGEAVALAGATASLVSSSAALAEAEALASAAASSASSSTFSGSAVFALALAGSAVATSSSLATATVAEALAASSAALNVTMAGLSEAEALGASAAVGSVLSGNLQALTGTQFAAVSTSLGSFTATASLTIALAATETSITVESASLGVTYALMAGSTSASSVSATAGLVLAITASTVDLLTASGNLQVLSGTQFAATAISSASFAATLQMAVAVSGISSGVATVAPALGIATTLAARSTSSSAAGGNLLAPMLFTGAVVGVSTDRATLASAYAIAASSNSVVILNVPGLGQQVGLAGLVVMASALLLNPIYRDIALALGQPQSRWQVADPDGRWKLRPPGT